MITFPNCKINLGLHILEKRSDGYHQLETVFYPLPLKDILEIIESEKGVVLSESGLPVDGNENDNLCVKTYQLLKNDFPDLPAIKIHLHKGIPPGAGLGGGSADAAFMLTLLNKKFNLALSKEKLLEYSLQLGSDCPFFIFNKPCFASGRGELLEEIEMDLSGYKFLVIIPDIPVRTAWAFSQLNLKTQKKEKKGALKKIIQQPVYTWKESLVNDFEEIIFSNHPDIALIKEKLYDAGATYAS
ncbi:MAG TPA: 4-(cytidine 5'-diphospho)-2-C-methyl-D-erythritol kinase, partial [Chitinophagaceae bacterium]|nr:4-(cytidine 5'-diphospho)-2-C-methyl-D-erythritol kinase [Chitinophagaceae bacterium]